MFAHTLNTDLSSLQRQKPKGDKNLSDIKEQNREETEIIVSMIKKSHNQSHLHNFPDSVVELVGRDGFLSHLVNAFFK